MRRWKSASLCSTVTLSDKKKAMIKNADMSKEMEQDLLEKYGTEDLAT